MKLLTIPYVDNKSVYASVLQNKRIICSDKNSCNKYKKDSENCRKKECSKCNQSPRAVLVRYENKIIKQYEEYVNAAPCFEKMDLSFEFGAELERELRKSYKNSQKFAEVRKIIFKNFNNTKIGRCPFCMLSDPDTLDHYLSESKYPQFILYAPNLVPCCSTCNNDKKATLISDEKKRIFFHYYYDELPEEPILECSVFLSNGKPDYSYYVNTAIDCINADIFRRQFVALSLGNRYQKACIGKLSTLLDELKDLYKQGGINLCEYILNIRLKHATNNLGKNHYETAMLRGVIKDLALLVDN